MKKTRELIQHESLLALKKVDYNGCVVLSTGTGKSKVAIDAIKQSNFKNILITSPRTNLKENWRKELEKWNIIYKHNNSWRDIENEIYISIVLENIQTCYKWDHDQIKQFDLIIADEIHTMVTEEYGALIKKARSINIPTIGLTATPDDEKEDKANFYNSHCPIIYEYHNSAADGLINKRKNLVFRYELSNDFKVKGGTKKKPFDIGESDQYKYLTEQVRKGQKLMATQDSESWWDDAVSWFYKGQGTFDQKVAGRIYLQSIKYRKEFLWNLTSSKDFALIIKSNILNKHIISPEYKDLFINKILLFSENINQATKLSQYSIHSKQKSEINKKLLKDFDDGIIKELSSIRSLTLGLNIKDANYIIRESYNGSSANSKQINGRGDRLNVNDISTIIWLVPINTQAEQWFNKAITGENKDDITYYTDINKLITNL